jgi:hypothetical protein
MSYLGEEASNTVQRISSCGSLWSQDHYHPSQDFVARNCKYVTVIDIIIITVIIKREFN